MFHTVVRIVVIALGFGGALPAAPLSAQRNGPPPSAERMRERADRRLDTLHARGLFAGAVVLGRGEEELYARGFGPANRAAGVPFTPDTPADGASIAKTLTAAAVFMLVDEGRVRLDDPVTTYVPEYPHPDTRVRDLLSHSSGLPEIEYDFLEGLVPKDSVKTTLRLRGLRAAPRSIGWAGTTPARAPLPLSGRAPGILVVGL